MGASWASGVRLYASVATLGLLHHFRLTKLPGGLEALAHPWVIGVAIVMFVAEFFADKVPLFDTAWDAVHTFIRIPAGVVLASMAFAKYPTHIILIAGLMGGSLALTSHVGKSTNRLVINHSPEPVTNWGHSAWNDISSIAIIMLAPFAPVFTISLVIFLFVVSCVILVKAWPHLKRPFLKRSKGK